MIQDVDTFYQAIDIVINQAQAGKLVTFGITPREANSGYGYIKSSKDNDDGAYKVDEFVEKPNITTAEYYLEEGNYLWNSGMFMFKGKTLLDGLVIHSPDIVKSVQRAINNATRDLDFIRLDKKSFESSSSG